MKPMYQRKRGLLRVAAIGQVIIMVGAGCKSSSPKEGTGINDVSVSQALVGKDQSRTVTVANTVVNGYAALAANAAAGDTSVQVSDLDDFTSGTPARPALAIGDLVLIIQMAGATISVPADPSDADYGEVTNLGNAGRYEFAGVTAVNGTTNTITLSCGLKHAYTAAGKTQVVRVPQYTNLTINSGASITADAWNGTVGGVVAVHAMNTIMVTGGIDVNGKGFRGGVAHDGSNNTTGNVTTYWSANGDDGAMKGEGIAGDPNDAGFTNKYGRGAPANAGGGGNLHNSGGGGGANASASGTWTGQGVMLASVVGGTSAWALDPNTGANSPGGGRGGYTYSDSDQDATTLAPGQVAWGGNDRRERGGLGGRPLASNTGGTDARLFMGGGGGAGDGNDGQTISGGNGGGLVFLIAGTVTGEGTISANGAQGGDSGSRLANSNSDGGGGGGGGGTIVVHAGVLSQIHITANGGRGGNQRFTALTGTEAEGPGGGGGGGFVALSGGTPASVAADGALGGTTDSPALTEFPTNGATAGHAGVTNASADSLMYCTDWIAPQAVIIDKPTNPSNLTTFTFTFGGLEANSDVDAGDRSASFECKLDTGDWASCSNTHTVTGLTEGTHTIYVRVKDLSGNPDGGYGGETSYTWRVDLMAPIPRILTGPGGDASGGTSNSSTAHFTFTATEMDSGIETVTFLCRLDNSASGFEPCNADHTITGLGEGTHTLEVRARDDSGNSTPSVDGGDLTAIWIWTVALIDGGADGGEDDGDAGSVDAVFGDAADAGQGIDTGGTVLDARPDTRDALGADRAVDTNQRDTSISPGDAARDGVDAEAGEIGDAADGDDGLSSDAVSSGDAVVADSSQPRDTSVVPSPDASVTPDAAQPPGKQDAALPTPADEYKLMGGGFCSMNPSGDGTPGLATLFLVVAFGLLIVRRRRS